MVAVDLGPVVHNLILILVLRQRAVAARDVETASVLRASALGIGAVAARISKLADFRKVERRSTVGKSSSGIEIRDTQLIGKLNVLIVFAGVDAVAVVAQAEVRQQVGADRNVRACRRAVVCANRGAPVAGDTESGASSRTEDRGAGKGIGEAAEPAKDVNLVGGLSVTTHIPLVAVEDACAARPVVVLQEGPARQTTRLIGGVRLQQLEES